jgi:hypothetical protein
MVHAPQLTMFRFGRWAWVAFELWSGCADVTSPAADVMYPADAAPLAA